MKVIGDEDFSAKYLCDTCKRYLKAKKLPPMCFKNGLTIEAMPNDLKLSELEAVLCSKKIIFAKIFTLPRNTMSGSKDKVVNVPITSDKLRETFDKITTFPRQPIDGGLLVSVKLKRKVAYKKQCLPTSFIDPVKVVKAAQYYKNKGHPQYQNIEISENYLPQISIDLPDPDLEPDTSLEASSKDHN